MKPIKFLERLAPMHLKVGIIERAQLNHIYANCNVKIILGDKNNSKLYFVQLSFNESVYRISDTCTFSGLTVKLSFRYVWIKMHGKYLINDYLS